MVKLLLVTVHTSYGMAEGAGGVNCDVVERVSRNKPKKKKHQSNSAYKSSSDKHPVT